VLIHWNSGTSLGFRPPTIYRLVPTSAAVSAGERGQPVAVHGATRGEAGRGPLLDGRPPEVRYDGKLGAQRTAILADRDGGNERDLVLRATTDLATAALTPEVGVIDLDLAGEDITRLPLGHHLHQFVLNEPGRWVTHPQLPLQRECRKPGLRLTDEVR